jgi:ATP synthase protein I
MKLKKPSGQRVNKLLHASSIGMSFVISILIGIAMGVWFDGKFDTKPYGTIFFLVCGIIAGFRNMIYFMKKAGVFDENS